MIETVTFDLQKIQQPFSVLSNKKITDVIYYGSYHIEEQFHHISDAIQLVADDDSGLFLYIENAAKQPAAHYLQFSTQIPNQDLIESAHSMRTMPPWETLQLLNRKCYGYSVWGYPTINNNNNDLQYVNLVSLVCLYLEDARMIGFGNFEEEQCLIDCKHMSYISDPHCDLFPLGDELWTFFEVKHLQQIICRGGLTKLYSNCEEYDALLQDE